jgi:transglutaminase-like putative cysteine protease
MNFEMEGYLKATPLIDCEAKPIKEKAEDLTKGQEDTIEKAKSLFYFVRDKIKYNPYLQRYLPEHFQASKTLSRGEGFCFQKAALLVALSRSVGIPARLGLAHIRNYLLPDKIAKLTGTNVLPDHGYAELYLEGKWVKATPAFDLKMCQKNRIIPVEFDGKNDAKFHSHNQDGKLHIEYVKDCGTYQDVPLDKIWEALTQALGSKYIDWGE